MTITDIAGEVSRLCHQSADEYGSSKQSIYQSQFSAVIQHRHSINMVNFLFPASKRTPEDTVTVAQNTFSDLSDYQRPLW
jgi:hypothetical protein